MSISEQLATFVVNTRIDDMPREAIEKAKVMFLDIIGVALAGTRVEETGKIAIDYVREAGGVPESTVIGGGFMTSALNAALANALSAHALDFDDFEPAGHPSGMLVVTALALGEKCGLTGQEVLQSYILGLEIYEHLATIDGMMYEKGWHGTPVFGTMGSAAAAAKALGLSVSETVMCLGIAASSASGILRENGSMTKPYQVGKAARNGVEAALLAQKGFTSDLGVIENPKGFCDLFAGKGQWDASQLTRNLGNPFHIASPSIGIKLYPCGGVKFVRCIQGILELREENNIKYSDVREVDLRVSRQQLNMDITEPHKALEGKFSMRYICARALLDGQLKLDSFTDDKVNDPVIKEAMGKMNVIVDEEIPNKWLNSWSEVSIHLKNGNSYTRRIEIPKGDSRNPVALSVVKVKYQDNASLVLSEKQAERAAEIVLNLDNVKNLHELMNILKAGDGR